MFRWKAFPGKGSRDLSSEHFGEGVQYPKEEKSFTPVGKV
jgi:hypothetical protein